MYKLYNGIRFPMERPSLENTRIMDHGILGMVNGMMRAGVLIDKPYLAEFAGYLRGEEDRVTSQVTEMTGLRVNLGSADQIADLLFRRLMIKPRFTLKLVPTGKREIINDEVLESIKDYPIPGTKLLPVPLIQEFTELFKLRTSFAEPLPLFADVNGRIHGTIKLTRVVTGRIAMSSPNLMGIPTRSDLGKRIRKGFVAPPGRMLGQIDLSQAQMRGAAHLAQCENMINIFLEDGDVHSQTASRMFRLPVDKLDKYIHRYPAKRTGFGVLFGITAEGLQDQLVVASDQSWTAEQRADYAAYWSIEQCQKMLDDWYGINHEIRTWQSMQVARARRHAMVWCPFGRPRMVPGVRSIHKHIRADAEREAMNTPVASTEVGIMKLGMAEIWDTIENEGWDCIPLFQVHDSLVCEGDKYLPEYMNEMVNIFANAVPLDVPIKSDVDCGEGSWADL